MPELNEQAVQVRLLIEQVAARFNANDPNWRADFDRAKAILETIEDPVSRTDAAIRVSNIEQHLCQLAGDTTGALHHCDQVLEAIGQQRLRFPDQAEQIRLNDHEWVIRMAKAQILMLTHLPGASIEAHHCLELAATTLAPESRRASTLMIVAGNTLYAQNYPQAQAEYAEAVELCRQHAPESLGLALLGLAQAQAQSGALAAASATAERAQPLIADDAGATADLLQLRSTITQACGDGLEAQRFATEYAAHSASNSEWLLAHQRHEAAKTTAHLTHLSGEVFAAREHYAQLVDAARNRDDPVALAITLLDASCATQDCALVLGPQAGLHDHLEALAQIDQARAILAEIGQLVYLAGADYQRASFVAQFYPVFDEHTEPALRDALLRCQAAALFLQHISFAAGTGPERHDFVVQHAMAAFETAFSLAFWFGDSRQVAELIELRCSSAQFQAGPIEAPRPGDLTAALAGCAGTPDTSVLRASPPPPLLFAPGEPLLPAAFARARQEYGLTVLGAGAPTW